MLNKNISTRRLCPIQRTEWLKFLSISLFIFVGLFAQNIIRITKDALINTLVGTEVVVFLKSFVVLPVSIIFTILYIKATNKFRVETIFISIILLFILFFMIFGFIIFPNYEYVHLNNISQQKLILQFPHLKWFILLISNWSFSLFYLFAELWPNIILALLIWQLINAVTTVEESAKFYPLLGIISQSNLIFSGIFFSKINKLLKEFTTPDLIFVTIIVSTVFCCGIILIIIFKFLNYKFFEKASMKLDKKKQDKTSIREIFLILRKYKYIRYITIILICYGLAINLIEAPWRAATRDLHNNLIDFGVFNGENMLYTGIVTLSMVLISYFVISKYGWYIAALVTPIIMLSTGVLFFLSYTYFSNSRLMRYLPIMHNIDWIHFTVLIGAIQNILSRGSKYSFFDTTKEMSYVPLPYDLKNKGKAIADISGTKIGKSLSSFLQSFIFIIFPNTNYHSTAFVLMISFVSVIIIWIIAVSKLNTEYKKLTL